tara:strand:+ start:153 stop:1070 length:918 start_codon:yes stop_codon:yes gene_type:complete
MAFQTGSQIDPRLMKMDYSGYAKAGEIQANALANLGAQVGAGIEKYQKNKEITGVTLASIEGILASNPDLIAQGQAEEGSIGKSFKKLQEDGNLNKQSAMEVKGYLDTIMESRAAQKQSEMDAATLANVQAQTSLRQAQAAAAGQSTPESISTKKLASGQAFLDENNLIVKDGQLYEKEESEWSNAYGFLGGSATPVQNPEAYLGVEGVRQLLEMSKTSGTVMAQPQDGWSSTPRDAVNAPTRASVSADALNSAGGIPTANQKPASYNPAMQDAGASIGQGLRNLGNFLSPSDVEKYYTPGQGIR